MNRQHCEWLLDRLYRQLEGTEPGPTHDRLTTAIDRWETWLDNN